MQILEAFGFSISRFAVARILRKSKHNLPSGDGPSWLTFIGHMTDSLWSVDLFRCESASLKSHWVMVVIDQFTRRIIGFAVHPGDCDGIAYCRMLNQIIAGKSLPKYLSSDNDQSQDRPTLIFAARTYVVNTTAVLHGTHSSVSLTVSLCS